MTRDPGSEHLAMLRAVETLMGGCQPLPEALTALRIAIERAKPGRVREAPAKGEIVSGKARSAVEAAIVELEQLHSILHRDCRDEGPNTCPTWSAIYGLREILK